MCLRLSYSSMNSNCTVTSFLRTFFYFNLINDILDVCCCIISQVNFEGVLAFISVFVVLVKEAASMLEGIS